MAESKNRTAVFQAIRVEISKLEIREDELAVLWLPPDLPVQTVDLVRRSMDRLKNEMGIRALVLPKGFEISRIRRVRSTARELIRRLFRRGE